MAKFFDGQSARPHQVRVLLLNKQINVYEADTLVYSSPLSDCSLQKTGNKIYVYLTADATIFVVLEEDTPAARLIAEEIQFSKTDASSKLMQMKLPVLIGMLLLLGALVFFTFTWAIPAIGLKAVSVKQEQEFGNTIYNTIVEQQKVDSSSTPLLQQFANHLQLSDKYHLRVIVVKDKQVNAFALPGGIIVVYSGIIQNMHSYEELAALLGHEVTHINNRHSLRSILKSMSVSTAVSLVFGNASSGIINSASQLNQLSYSRKLESEADKTGIELLYKNHINPNGMVKLMQDLEAIEKIKTIGFLSSHPLTNERIKSAKEAIKKLPHEQYAPHPELEVIWKQLKNEKAEW